MMLPRLQASPRAATAWTEAPCPLCDGERFEIALESQDPAGDGGRVFCVVRCRSCGLHFTNPRPDESSIGDFYPEDYKPHARRNARRRALGRSRLAWLTGRDTAERRGELPVDRPGRLLDFGCGSGSYLARMAELGWSVTGLDASPNAVRTVRHELNVPAFLGSLPHQDLEACSFDAITMWHALEHVHEPRAVLRAAFELLVPGGVLLIAVPNIGSLPARWFGPDWFGLDLPRHLTHFDRRTLSDMLLLEGFEVQSLRGVKHSDWLRSSAELAARRGRGTRLQRCLRWKPAAKLAAWYTWLTNSCDCLLAIARRPDPSQPIHSARLPRPMA